MSLLEHIDNAAKRPLSPKAVAGILSSLVLLHLVLGALTPSNDKPTPSTAAAPPAVALATSPVGPATNGPPPAARVQFTFDSFTDMQRIAFCSGMASHMREQAQYTLEGRDTAYTRDRAVALLQQAYFNRSLLASYGLNTLGVAKYKAMQFDVEQQVWPALNELPGVEIEATILWKQCGRIVQHLIEDGKLTAADVNKAKDVAEAGMTAVAISLQRR